MKLPVFSQNKTRGGPPQQWKMWISWGIWMLVLLWLWQEGAPHAVVRTIPYSEFKDYLHQGEVVECSVRKTEIDGNIQPHAHPAAHEAETSATTKTRTTSETASAAKGGKVEPSVHPAAHEAGTSATAKTPTTSEAASAAKGTAAGSVQKKLQAENAEIRNSPAAPKGSSEASVPKTEPVNSWLRSRLDQIVALLTSAPKPRVGSPNESSPAASTVLMFRTVRVDDPTWSGIWRRRG